MSVAAPHFLPLSDAHWFEQAMREFAAEGYLPCPGTQDYLQVWPWGGPAFDKTIARRLGCSVDHVDRVIGNRFCSSRFPDIHFGGWDWRVCREAITLLREYEIAADWICERSAVRNTRLSRALLRCGAEHGHIRAKQWGNSTYYFRRDLGLRPGKYRAFRQRRAVSLPEAA